MLNLASNKFFRFVSICHLTVKSIGEQGGGGSKGLLPPLEKKYDPPLAFKMTPTPSEMAF